MPLVLTDYPVFKKTANGNAAQVVEIDCLPVPQGSLWRVDQVACIVFPGTAGAISAPPQVAIFDTIAPGATAIPLQSSELYPYPPPYGNVNAPTVPSYWGDWDAEAGPFTIRGGDQLAIVFTGVPVGAVAAVRVQYGLFMGTPGAPTPIST